MKQLYRWLLVFTVVYTQGAAAAGGQEKPVTEPSATSVGSQSATAPVLQTPNPRYQIRVGDTVDISFKLTPEFNQTVMVQPDGYISLRDLTDLFISGKTVPEVSELLQKRYSKILHDPSVTVTLKDFEKPYFIANGELGHPGKYELLGDTTVLQAIGIAGGINERSKHSQVLLFRRVSDQWMSVKKLDMKEMLNTANLSEDLRLRPGDMIYVPKNKISKIKPWIPIPSFGVYGPVP
jgi:polysaccharide export outer membrane protein